MRSSLLAVSSAIVGLSRTCKSTSYWSLSFWRTSLWNSDDLKKTFSCEAAGSTISWLSGTMPYNNLSVGDCKVRGKKGSKYQKFVNGLRDLVLGSGYGDYITCHFGAWKINFAIPFLLKLFNLIHSSNELSMVQAVDDDGLRDKFCVLCSTLDMSDVCRGFVDGCRRLL